MGINILTEFSVKAGRENEVIELMLSWKGRAVACVCPRLVCGLIRGAGERTETFRRTTQFSTEHFKAEKLRYAERG
jgi:hypothetical protein